jgi:predicted TIM-barrel fold metal-dependent hydrolase
MTIAARGKWFSSLTVSIALLAANFSASAQTPADQMLLKDYRPRSVYKVPDTRVPRARYPAIDMHSHPYAKTAQEIDRWVQTMDDVGLEKTMILTAAVGKKFDEVAAQFRKHPDRFALWCGFDFTGYDKPGYGPAAVAELERCHKAGAIGVGEMGDKGKGLFYSEPQAWGMHIDDPRMDPLLEKCAELGMPVNIHVAEPIWMYQPMDASNDGLMNAYEWRLDNQPGIVSHQGMIDTLERAVRKHPRTVFIACHFANCCYDLAILGRLLDRYPNLYADIGARYAETATIPRYVARFYEKYQDRLLYGTDMGFDAEMYRTTFRILETEDEHFYAFDLFTYHWPLHGFGLSDPVLKKLYRENALKILGGAKTN